MNKERNQQQMIAAKNILKQTLKKYLLYFIPIFICQLILLITFIFIENNARNFLSWILVACNGLNAITFLVIFDGIPARTIRKGNYVVNKMSKDQGIVFYNGLRYRTIFRGLINIIATLIILIFALLYVLI